MAYKKQPPEILENLFTPAEWRWFLKHYPDADDRARCGGTKCLFDFVCHTIYWTGNPIGFSVAMKIRTLQRPNIRRLIATADEQIKAAK